MSTPLVIALVVLGALGLALLVNKNAVFSWFNLGRTKVGQWGDAAKGIDPAGQMRQAALDAAAELGNADQALVDCDVLVKRLDRQVAQDKVTLGKLEGQIANKLQGGASDNDPAVVEKLKRVRDLKKSIEENERQAELQRTSYKKLLAQANAAGAKISDAMRRADQMKVRLDLGAQSARINEMLSKYNPAAVQTKLAKIDEFEQIGQTKLDTYESQSRVMADRNSGQDDEDDVNPETDPELGDLLADIRSKRGLDQTKTTK